MKDRPTSPSPSPQAARHGIDDDQDDIVLRRRRQRQWIVGGLVGLLVLGIAAALIAGVFGELAAR
ncbi:MAG: hypothetical protein RIM84_04470 [Alphaproteobacteria bacterium]